jgi:hypothetical protein
MRLGLNPNIHSCIVNGRVIFLDALNGRYFCLSDRLEQAFLDVAGGNISGCNTEIEEMIGRGVLVTDAPAPKALLPLSTEVPPSRDLSSRITRSSLADVGAAAAAQAYAMIILRTNHFHEILRRLESKRNAVREQQGRNGVPTAERLALAIQTTNLLFGSTDRCLNRSLALLQLCYRHGSTPTFVIGVRTSPFVAHCWVQDHDLVLNDRSEHARLFTPIFAL